MPKRTKWNELPCPVCKEPAAISATKCPHCATQFTDNQVRERKGTGKATWIAVAIIVLILVLSVAMCSGGSDETGTAAPSNPAFANGAAETPATEADLKKAREEAVAAFPQEKLPAGVPEAPVTLFCSTTLCETSQASFSRRDWPMAWQGDYQGQRNVAFCRRDGCDGAVQINEAEACAWRVIILAAHPEQSDDTDTANLTIACGDLDPIAVASARRKAKAFYQRIYGKAMPDL